jgi:uncharacterized OB-fold protein
MTGDWTSGVEAILYQHCPGCSATWYFARDFCPRCGRAEPERLEAAGMGVVHAATLVERAPSPELRPLAPYAILLVDMVGGFRMMAQGDKTLRIDDAVAVRFLRFVDRLIPYFERI